MSNRILVLLAALTLGTAASAQKQAPGLWEITMQTQSQSGQSESANAKMREQLAQMPPEQRKMMEEMMAKQGIGMGGGGQSMRICISKEQAARGEVPQDPNGNCKNDISDRSASGMKFKFACTNPASSGVGEIAFGSDKAYTMKMQVDTTVQGKPERMHLTHTGRWVAADCGNLAPRKP